jgi:hypothetical protein
MNTAVVFFSGVVTVVAACQNAAPIAPPAASMAPAPSAVSSPMPVDAADFPDASSERPPDAAALEANTGDHLALCIRRERDLPIDEAGGLAPKPLPRRLYWIQIDDGERIEVRPDTGTLVSLDDGTQPHRVALFRGARRVAAASIRFDPRGLCLGLSNYSGSVSVYTWDAKRCGCADAPP